MVEKLAGFTMPMFKTVMEHGAHVFKIHEKTAILGVSNVELEGLLAKAHAPRRERRQLAAHVLLLRPLSPFFVWTSFSVSTCALSVTGLMGLRS